MGKRHILITVSFVLLLTLLCVLCLAGCKKNAPTAEGILVRYGDSSMSSRGGDPLTVSVSAGDTPETIDLANRMTVELQMSDGTTKPLAQGADGYRIEGDLPAAVEANTAYTLRIVYGDYAVTLQLVAPPAVPTIEVNKNLNKEYDGQPVSLTAEDYVIVGESTPVFAFYEQNTDGTWRALDAAPADAGTYKLIITLAASKHFSEGTYEVPFEIVRGVPQVEQPTLPNVFNEGEISALTDIVLPAGFTWDEGQTLVYGRHVYYATYTPADTRNYETRSFWWEFYYRQQAEFTGTAPSFTGTYTPGVTLAGFPFADTTHWRWEDPTTPVTCNQKVYTALWYPEGFDAPEYSPARVGVTVALARADAYDESMKPGTIEVYADEVTSLLQIDPNKGLDRSRGFFRFESGQELLPGRHTYTLEFVPADAVNYRIVIGIEVEVVYRSLKMVPTVQNDCLVSDGTTLILSLSDDYDGEIMEAVDKDGNAMASEQMNAGVYTYYFRLKDKDLYAWEGYTTEDQAIVWTILPYFVTPPTPKTTVAALEGGSVTFGWYGWDSSRYTATTYGTAEVQLPGGEFTAMTAGRYGVRVSLINKNITAWEDGTTDDLIVYFVVLEENPVTSVRKNGNEIGLGGLNTGDLVLGDVVGITAAEGYTVSVNGTAVTGDYTVPTTIGAAVTFRITRDSDGTVVYTAEKTVLAPIWDIKLDGRELTWEELADAVFYNGSHLTFMMRSGYTVVTLQNGGMLYHYGGVSIDDNSVTSFTLEIRCGTYETGTCLFRRDYTVKSPLLSVTVDGEAWDVAKVLDDSRRPPAGARIGFTLADGFTLEINGEAYTGGTVLASYDRGMNLTIYNAENMYVGGYSLTPKLGDITVNGEAIDGSYQIKSGDTTLTFRVSSRLAFEWSAHYGDDHTVEGRSTDDGTFTVDADGLTSVWLYFEVEPHSTAAYTVGIDSYTTIDSISARYVREGWTEPGEETARKLSGSGVDYALPDGYLLGLRIQFADGFTGTYRVLREDGMVIDENGTWVNGGYGDVASLGEYLTLEILDTAGNVAETHTLAYDASMIWFNFSGEIVSMFGVDGALRYFYTNACATGTAYDAAAWTALFYDGTGVDGYRYTLTVNGGENITFTARDVYTLACVLRLDAGDGHVFTYRTELVVNLTELFADYWNGTGQITLGDKDGERSDVVVNDTYLNVVSNINEEGILAALKNGLVVRWLPLKEGYTATETKLVTRDGRVYLRLTFREDATDTLHTSVLLLGLRARIDDDTAADEWYAEMFDEAREPVTPDGDTVTLEDWSSMKIFVVSTRNPYAWMALYDADGTLVKWDRGSMYVSFGKTGTYTLKVVSTDTTAEHTYTIIVKGAFDPIFEVKAGEGDDEKTLWADNDPDEEMPVGNCYMDEDGDGNLMFVGYFGRGMQAYIVTADGVEYLPVRFRSSLVGFIFADEEGTVPLTAGEVRLAVQTEGGRRYVAAYVMIGGDIMTCRFYLEDHAYPATITAGETDYVFRIDDDSMDFGDLVPGEDGLTLTVPAGVTTITLKLARIYADESYTVIDSATGAIFRVTDQDTLSVEIPLTFTDGVAVLYICPEGTTNADNAYPLLIGLAAE